MVQIKFTWDRLQLNILRNLRDSLEIIIDKSQNKYIEHENKF